MLIDLQKAARSTKWQSADGRYLTIHEMHTSHLLNTAKMLFNHMLMAHPEGNEDKHRVLMGRAYPSIERRCLEQPREMLMYLAIMLDQLQRRELLETERRLVMDILSQLISRYDREPNSKFFSAISEKRLSPPSALMPTCAD